MFDPGADHRNKKHLFVFRKVFLIPLQSLAHKIDGFAGPVFGEIILEVYSDKQAIIILLYIIIFSIKRNFTATGSFRL